MRLSLKLGLRFFPFTYIYFNISKKKIGTEFETQSKGLGSNFKLGPNSYQIFIFLLF
jgi:hypothetical protein